MRLTDWPESGPESDGDLPALADRGDADGLAGRLARLPGSHPSSAAPGPDEQAAADAEAAELEPDEAAAAEPGATGARRDWAGARPDWAGLRPGAGWSERAAGRGRYRPWFSGDGTDDPWFTGAPGA